MSAFEIFPGQVRQFNPSLKPYIGRKGGSTLDYQVQGEEKFIVTDNSFGHKGEIWAWEILLENGIRVYFQVDQIYRLTHPV